MKNIIIIVLLAVLVGGGWFLLRQGPEKPVIPEGTESPEETVREDETADWQVYKNKEYGFEMKYPENFFSAQPNHQLKAEIIQCDYLNLADDCSLEMITINGRSFCPEETSGAAAGINYVTYGYTTAIDAKCFVISFTVAYPNCSYYLPDQEKHDQCELENEVIKSETIDKILSTFKFIKEESPEKERLIKIISPNGEEEWTAGNAYDIKWELAPGSKGVGIQIAYTSEGADLNKMGTIITHTIGTSYRWSIPSNFLPGKYRIQIRMVNGGSPELIPSVNYDFSDNYFSIILGTVTPSITAISPQDGDEWTEGKIYDIVWTSRGVDKVNIAASVGGKDKGYIAFGINTALGKYSWTIPQGFVSGFGINSSDRVRLRIYDANNQYIFVESDYFTVEAPVIKKDLNLIIEEKKGKIILKINSLNDIYIPKASLSSSPYFSGPWSVYYRTDKTRDWSQLRMSDLCVSLWCDDSCDIPPLLCDVIPHPPSCETVSGEYIFEWEREHLVRATRICNDQPQLCYKFVSAEPGEYKIVFSYKTDPCPALKDYPWIEKGVFQNDIQAIEKIFYIQ